MEQSIIFIAVTVAFAYFLVDRSDKLRRNIEKENERLKGELQAIISSGEKVSLLEKKARKSLNKLIKHLKNEVKFLRQELSGFEQKFADAFNTEDESNEEEDDEDEEEHDEVKPSKTSGKTAVTEARITLALQSRMRKAREVVNQAISSGEHVDGTILNYLLDSSLDSIEKEIDDKDN